MNTFSNSISDITRGIYRSLNRFPLVIGLAGLISLVSIVLIIGEDYRPLWNVIMCAALGVPLLFSTTIMIENKVFKNPILVQSLALSFLVGLFFTLPMEDHKLISSLAIIRYSFINAAVHLFLSFAPFLKKGNMNGFWQYNRMLFQRTLSSILFSGVLLGGFCAALGLIDLLLGVNIPGQLYGILAVIFGSLVNIWIFMSGVPEAIDKLDEDLDYPRNLKMFLQFVLLPLLVLYVVILISYLLKIAIIQDGSEGIISRLIIGVSVLGVLTLLLLNPYSKLKEGKWLAWVTKAYYLILTPLAIILFVALSYRVSAYGITINRYILGVIGLWLLGISLHFNFAGKNIKVIPISLSLLTILSIIGPWSVLSVSEKSQFNRLNQMLVKEQMLVDGKLKIENRIESAGKYYDEDWKTAVLPDENLKEIESVLTYLTDYHEFNSLQPLFNQDLTVLEADSFSDFSDRDFEMKLLGLRSLRYFEQTAVAVTVEDEAEVVETEGVVIEDYFYYTRKDQEVIPIGAYDFMIPIDPTDLESVEGIQEYQIGGQDLVFKLNSDMNLELIGSDKKAISVSILPFLEGLTSSNGKPLRLEQMSFKHRSEDINLSFVFNEIEYVQGQNENRLKSYSGYLMVKFN